MSHATVPQARFTADDWNLLARTHENHLKIHAETAKVIVCPKAVIDEILMALFCDAHVLLSGCPGLARGLLLWTLSKVLDLAFSRIQFTSDLLPDDITGCEVIQEDRTTGRRESRFIEGPIYSNMIKADEINLAPPETQAVLLQAMQEGVVSVGGRRVQLEKPFLVVASHYRWERNEAYPLPASQLDRFLFNPCWDYPSDEESIAQSRLLTQKPEPTIDRVLERGNIEQIQRLVRRLPVAESVIDYVVQTSVMACPVVQGAGVARDYADWGFDPHLVQSLAMAAKARAVLHGQAQASIDDVNAIAPSVLRHRMHRND